jgi:hypothetical protein
MRRRELAQVLLDGTEQDRIEALVTEFDPATRPGPLREKLSGDDLEVMRKYVAGLMRARVSAELLARASEGLLEPAEELPIPFEDESSAILLRYQDDELHRATFDPVWTARDKYFGEPNA